MTLSEEARQEMLEDGLSMSRNIGFQKAPESHFGTYRAYLEWLTDLHEVFQIQAGREHKEYTKVLL